MNFYFHYYYILGLQKTVASPLGSKKKYFCSSACKNVILILETKSRIDLMADDDKLAWLVLNSSLLGKRQVPLWI